MKYKLLIVCFFFTSFTVISAQDAKQILDNAAIAYNNAGAIDATFTLSVKEEKTNSIQNYTGTAKMKGNMFRINLNDLSTWFDGKTQWSYIKETNEVNITEPTGEELQGISPSSLFSIYEKGYKLKYNGEKRFNSKVVEEIEMTPENKNSNFSRLIVIIYKANKMLSQIIASDQNGYTHTLIITDMKSGVNSIDSDYKFNESEYPQAEIIDLR